MEKLKEVKAVSCDRCGNTWLPRVKNPIKCPKCGRRFDSRTPKTTSRTKKRKEGNKP
jgi:rubrerythrin